MTPTCSTAALLISSEALLAPFPSPAEAHLKRASCLFQASALRVLLLGRACWSLAPLGAPPHSAGPQQALHPHCQAQSSSRSQEQ